MSILNGRSRHGAALCVAAVVNVAMFHPVLAQDAGGDVDCTVVSRSGTGACS